jgi:hypothetical protein
LDFLIERGGEESRAKGGRIKERRTMQEGIKEKRGKMR